MENKIKYFFIYIFIGNFDDCERIILNECKIKNESRLITVCSWKCM
jgi:hypothetical protein